MTGTNTASPRFLYQRLISAQNALGQIKTRTELKQEPASPLNDIRAMVRPGLLSPIEIVVTSINPTLAWPSDSVQVEATVMDRTKTETSGTVTGDLLQDGFHPLFSSGFGGGALTATALGPGQKVSGAVTLKQWRAAPTFLKVGL